MYRWDWGIVVVLSALKEYISSLRSFIGINYCANAGRVRYQIISQLIDYQKRSSKTKSRVGVLYPKRRDAELL